MSEKIPKPAEDVLLKTEDKTKNLTGEFSPISLEGTFTVESYAKFSPRNLKTGDRAYVRTESGNVYRLERSSSRPGFIKFHNEQTDSLEYGTPTEGKDPNLEVGKPMYFTTWANPDDLKEGSQNVNSSAIREIEVWRSYAQALDDARTKVEKEVGGKGFGAAIADAAKNTAGGTKYVRDYRVPKK